MAPAGFQPSEHGRVAFLRCHKRLKDTPIESLAASQQVRRQSSLRERVESVSLLEAPDRRRTANPMAKIVVYTTSRCPYCHRAKALLRDKGMVFEEVDVTDRAELRALLREKAGGRTTVPQIWIDETHVGGFTDLYALDENGELDPLLEVG